MMQILDEMCYSTQHSQQPTHLGRLCCHLDPGLEDGYGELGIRTAAEPEAEVRMRFLNLQLLYEFVQLRHPAE